MDQVKFFNGCLAQILPGSFYPYLHYLVSMGKKGGVTFHFCLVLIETHSMLVAPCKITYYSLPTLPFTRCKSFRYTFSANFTRYLLLVAYITRYLLEISRVTRQKFTHYSLFVAQIAPCKTIAVIHCK